MERDRRDLADRPDYFLGQLSRGWNTSNYITCSLMDIGFGRQGNSLGGLSFSISSLILPDPSRTTLSFGVVAGLLCPFPGSLLVQSANSWIRLTLHLVLAPRRLHLWLVGQTIQHPQITFLLFRGFALSGTRTEREDLTDKSKEDFTVRMALACIGGTRTLLM